MLIGELADRVGVAARTVRFYERRGLMPRPRRTDSGYRVYNEDAVMRLTFVRHAQSAGLSLAEIKSVLDVRDVGRTPCEHVTALLRDKLAEVDERRAALDSLEATLSDMLDRAGELDPADCGPEEICHILSPPK